MKRNRIVGLRRQRRSDQVRTFYFIQHFCVECGTDLSKIEKCFIEVSTTNSKYLNEADRKAERLSNQCELQEAVEAIFYCEECYKEFFKKEQCPECDHYYFLPKWKKFLRRIFKSAFDCKDIDKCTSNSAEYSEFACGCPL